VRTLPDRPNIEHLRHQAKDLLAALRGSNPTATLADAQALLAEQYGFRSWTDLKAEVDRRQGHADVADPALAQAIANRFDLGQVTEPMRSVARADEVGRPWSLRTTKGRWWVRSLENWWPIVDVETEVGLQAAAAEAGILVPAPVRSRRGEIVEQVGEQRWRVNEWRHSGPPLTAPASAETTRSVGAILATLHRLALPVDRISPWIHRRLSTVSWTELATRAREEGAGWADELAAKVPILVELERIGSDGEDPVPVLSHTALGPSQVRRGEGGRLIVTGWEHAGGVPPAWELADALMHWTINPDGRVNVPAARGMVEGYAATASRVPALDLAAFRGAVTSLANYVHGQVQVALAATNDDDRRFVERSVRHVLAHLPTTSTLENLVEAGAGAAV
jgi:Putative homoserine kinase type II (protein kinase fold)